VIIRSQNKHVITTFTTVEFHREAMNGSEKYVVTQPIGDDSGFLLGEYLRERDAQCVVDWMLDAAVDEKPCFVMPSQNLFVEKEGAPVD
jgi:hypothetical protein